MRALRFALLAALVSVSVVESSAVLAKGTGGAAGGAGAGGASGGTGGGGGGGGAPVRSFSVVIDKDQVRPDPYHHRQVTPPWTFSSCFKQDELYDRFGYAVVNLHGAECFGQ